jgi:hypothetical protein
VIYFISVVAVNRQQVARAWRMSVDASILSWKPAVMVFTSDQRAR